MCKHHLTAQNMIPLPFLDEMLQILISNIDNNEQIRDSLKCYICLSKVTKPKMCNFCKKICCEYCINKWLEKKSYCGMCKHHITHQDMISLPFLYDMPLFFFNNIDNKENQSKKKKSSDLNKNPETDNFNDNNNNNVNNKIINLSLDKQNEEYQIRINKLENYIKELELKLKEIKRKRYNNK